LDYTARTMATNGHWGGNGILQRAWIESNLVTVARIALTNEPSFAADEKPQHEEFRLHAMVSDIVALSNFSGSIIPVGTDPHFALTVRVDTIWPALANFTRGASVTFAIHSPSRLFSAADPKGKTYDFTLSRETADGNVIYSGLEMRP